MKDKVGMGNLVLDPKTAESLLNEDLDEDTQDFDNNTDF